MPKECPDDKILNPATNRCVSKTGAIGKKLLKSSVSTPPAPTPAPAPKTISRRPMGMTKEEPIISVPKTISRRPMGMTKEEPIIPEPKPISRRPMGMTKEEPIISEPVPIPVARGDEIFFDASEYTPQMYKAARTIQKAVRKNIPNNFYDVPEYSPNMINAARTIQKAVRNRVPNDFISYINKIESPEYFYNPNYKNVSNLLEDINYTPPKYIKKTKKNQQIINDINKIQSSPEYMKGLFDKPTSLPKSSTDVLKNVLYINKLIKEENKKVNKPKIKRTNKRSMI